MAEPITQTDVATTAKGSLRFTLEMTTGSSCLQNAALHASQPPLRSNSDYEVPTFAVRSPNCVGVCFRIGIYNADCSRTPLPDDVCRAHSPND